MDTIKQIEPEMRKSTNEEMQSYYHKDVDHQQNYALLFWNTRPGSWEGTRESLANMAYAATSPIR